MQIQASINRPLLVTVGSIILLGVILGLFPKASPVSSDSPTVFPVVVTKGNAFTVNFEHAEVRPKLKLSYKLSNPAVIEVGGESFILKPGFVVKKNKRSYRAIKQEGGLTADVVVSLSGPSSKVSIYPIGDTPIKVSGFSYDVVKYRHVTTLSSLSKEMIYAVFGGFILLVILHYFFLPVAPNALRMLGLAATLGFILWVEWIFGVVLLLFLTGMYCLRFRYKGSSTARLFIYLSGSIGFLVFFKYAKVSIYSFIADPTGFSLLMPIGVSYFIIRLLDTQLRWYRGESVQFSFFEFLYFIVFPGTLVAGPIENIDNFYGKRLRGLSANDVARGGGRIIVGLAKKIFVAEIILYPPLHGSLWKSSAVNRFILDPAGVGGAEILFFGFMGVLFAYIDFSSYSDMAIGASRLLGHRIRENFNFPIFARNLREYWQRWHISLSEWSFRNAYFPLLIKTRNQYVPLYVTMLIIGVWHAWNLSWFSWAIHHATGMTVVSYFQAKISPRLTSNLDGFLQRSPRGEALVHLKTAFLRVLGTVLTLVYVSMGFIFVYFNDYTLALSLYKKIWIELITLGGLI